MADSLFSLVRTNFRHKDFQQLVEELEEDLNNRYGILQKKVYTTFNQTEGIQHVVLAFENEKVIGCGCFKIYTPETIEIKRFYVRKEKRGNGTALQILNELEKWASEEGYTHAILETGQKQPEAIRFYNKAGYIQIPNYGPYINQPNSVCMGKKL